MDIYTTSSVPRGTRATYWNDMYSRRFAQVTFNPLDREAFEAELKVAAMGPIAIARVHSQPTDIERNKAHIDRTCGRLFSFMLQVCGSGTFCHYGHESELAAGDFTLCDNSMPHSFRFRGDTELIILRTSPEVLRGYLPFPEQLCGLRLAAGKGLTGAAAQLAQSVWGLLETGLPEKFNPAVARNVLELVASAYAIAFDTGAAESTSASTRKVQAKRFIEAHLKDPDLTPCRVAQALHISPRYLRMLFSGASESVSNYILRRRLEECAKQISSVLWRGHTITDIALAWGFNSAAHFTRVFRDQYGLTPSRYRRTQLGADAVVPENPALRLS